MAGCLLLRHDSLERIDEVALRWMYVPTIRTQRSGDHLQVECQPLGNSSADVMSSYSVRTLSRRAPFSPIPHLRSKKNSRAFLVSTRSNFPVNPYSRRTTSACSLERLDFGPSQMTALVNQSSSLGSDSARSFCSNSRGLREGAAGCSGGIGRR